MASEHKGLPVISFATPAAWRQWLVKHHDKAPGLWLKFAKKDSGVASVAKPEAIAVAIAFGWIDGQINPFDDTAWLTRFTPRGPTSRWSQINQRTAERLIAAKQMAKTGLAEVEKAKADGRWAKAYAPQATATVPDDLQAALDAEPKARAFSATLDSANRYAVLYRVHDAKTAATRQARIDKFIAMLTKGETLHPPRKTKAKKA